MLTTEEITAIRVDIAAGNEPQASAWKWFLGEYVGPAMQAAAQVFPGPFRGVDENQARTLFGQLGTDGAEARDVGVAYAVTGRLPYARQVRDLLVAWARGNTPTTIGDWDTKDTGQLQTFGYFSFAYAYDLTRGAAVYSPDDQAAIASWFRRSIAALQSCLEPTLTDYFFLHPDTTKPYAGVYEWDSRLRYSKYDALVVGADFPALIQTASLAMAAMIGDTRTERRIMDGAGGDPLSIDAMISSALTPHNDGDGRGTSPVPQEKVYKSWSPRGGMVDYMTYNTRIFSVLVDMATNLGWNPRQVAAARAKLHTSWLYQARFFAPDAQPAYNPTDHINLEACLPRFALAWRDFGEARFRQVLEAGPWRTYYEPQLVGPVMVTHGSPASGGQAP